MKIFAAAARWGHRVSPILACAALLGEALAAPAAFEIDYDRSTIDVAVSATMDSFVGHLEKYEGSADRAGSDLLPERAGLRFDFADLKTGNKARDAAMLKWLNYDNQPKASFVLSGWSTNGMTNTALGELTMHGVKRAVQLPVKIKKEPTQWEVSGECKLDYRDFNLPKIRKAALFVVDPHLKVTFHLVGRQVAPKQP